MHVPAAEGTDGAHRPPVHHPQGAQAVERVAVQRGEGVDEEAGEGADRAQVPRQDRLERPRHPRRRGVRVARDAGERPEEAGGVHLVQAVHVDGRVGQRGVVRVRQHPAELEEGVRLHRQEAVERRARRPRRPRHRLRHHRHEEEVGGEGHRCLGPPLVPLRRTRRPAATAVPAVARRSRAQPLPQHRHHLQRAAEQLQRVRAGVHLLRERRVQRDDADVRVVGGERRGRRAGLWRRRRRRPRRLWEHAALEELLGVHRRQRVRDAVARRQPLGKLQVRDDVSVGACGPSARTAARDLPMGIMMMCGGAMLVVADVDAGIADADTSVPTVIPGISRRQMRQRGHMRLYFPRRRNM